MNSKYAYISALIILAVMISSVSAADNNLINKNFGNKAFTIDIPSDSDFNKEANSHINVGDLAMEMELFENKGDNSKDLAMILYLKDSSSNENILSEVIDDLKKDGDVIEENDNYLVIKNKKSEKFNLFNFNLGDIFNGLTKFIKGIFSQDNDVNVKSDDGDVKVSNEGITIVDSNNTKVSLSTKGLEVSDDGKNVSISTEGLEVSDDGKNVSLSSKDGVKVSDNESDDSNDDSIDGDISISGDLISNIDDADYSLCIKNQNNNQVIVLVGNNLDQMKSMADTASFSEN